MKVTDYLRQRSMGIVSFLFLILSFQLMKESITNPALPAHGARLVLSVTAPVQNAYSVFQNNVRSWINHYLWLIDVSAEREELINRNKALEAANSSLIEKKSENERLRSLLGYAEQTKSVGVSAQVIANDPSNWIKSITIDRGASSGLKPNQPVVDGNAIVGQTTTVGFESAIVLLLIDSRSAIDSLVQRTRVRGIVEGNFDNKLRLKFVAKDADVLPGDRIISSGLDGIFPKGTLVGVVTDITTGKNSLFKDIEVEPSVDFKALENVLAITAKPEEQEPPSQ